MQSLKVVANPESDTKSLGANVAAVAAAGLGVKCLADLRESELDSDAKREADRMPELLNQFARCARPAMLALKGRRVREDGLVWRIALRTGVAMLSKVSDSLNARASSANAQRC